MLALRAHDGRHIRSVGLHPVGTVIDPAGIGILHDHHAAGADVITAIVLVPSRRRNGLDVHVLAAVHVLQERPGLDGNRCDAARLLHVFAPIGDQLDRRAVDRHAEREVDAPHRGQNVRENAVTPGIAWNVIEQDRGIAHLAHVKVDDAADFGFALGAVDLLHLACRTERLDPCAQILFRHRRRFLRDAFRTRDVGNGHLDNSSLAGSMQFSPRPEGSGAKSGAVVRILLRVVARKDA